jgi:2-hydroxychromene-2-carboxylate isomerase
MGGVAGFSARPLCCCSWLFFLLPTGGMAQIKGEYKLLPGRTLPPAGSLQQVTVHEVFAFDCPYCYFFYRDEVPRLKQKFGDKIRFIPQPIGWRGHDPGRLMFIAQEAGKEKEVILMIFEFIFEKGLGESMFTRDRLQFVAQLNGLSEAFRSLMDAPDIVAKMNASVGFAKERRIQSTPTIVVADTLTVDPFYENLVEIINSLLVEPVP